jgi:hypothetical protein
MQLLHAVAAQRDTHPGPHLQVKQLLSDGFEEPNQVV